MKIESINNHLYFNTETSKVGWNSIPFIIKDFYNLKLIIPTPGCIRTLDDKIFAIYFYIESKVDRKSIVRFNYVNETLEFDSIYIKAPLINKEYFGELEVATEYRYDQYNNLVAKYEFGMDQIFCLQSKDSTVTKSYSRFIEPRQANDILREASIKYLNHEIQDELISAFHTSDNNNEIYWLIK